MPSIGLAALQNIPPAMVERIEVVKGPRSGLYGTDAIGGVINVITRRGASDGWTAEVGYGDYETRQASLSGGIATERLEFDLGVSWLDSAGFPTRTLDDTDRGYENLSATAQLRADVGPAEIALRHWRAGGTSEYSDFVLTPVDQDFTTATTALAVAWPLGSSARTEFGVSQLEDRTEQNQSRDFLRTVRQSADGQVDWRLSRAHSLGAGAMVTRERASSDFERGEALSRGLGVPRSPGDACRPPSSRCPGSHRLVPASEGNFEYALAAGVSGYNPNAEGEGGRQSPGGGASAKKEQPPSLAILPILPWRAPAISHVQRV